jgi:hypothetical protein
MKTVRKIVLCALLPALCAAGAVHAQGGGIGRSGTYGPAWSGDMMLPMDSLSAQKRDQAVQIREKMMQMEMDHEEEMMQTEMKYDQAMMQMHKALLDLYRGR